MKTLVLSGLEAAINRALTLDPSIRDALTPLHNKHIKIEFTDLHAAFFLSFQENHIAVLEDLHQPANTIISGTLRSFLIVAMNKGSQSAVFQNNMTVSGDIAIAEKLSSLFKHIQIDWEAHLAQLTGDTLAHQIAYHTKQLKNVTHRIVGQLKNTVKDYVFHEARYLPTTEDIEQLYLDIAVLKQDTERLEARIKRLQLQSGETS